MTRRLPRASVVTARYIAARAALTEMERDLETEIKNAREMRGDPNEIAKANGRAEGLEEAIYVFRNALTKRVR